MVRSGAEPVERIEIPQRGLIRTKAFALVVAALVLAVYFAGGRMYFGMSRVTIMEAASKGDTEKVQAMLAQGADVNAKTDDQLLYFAGFTALMLAKEFGHKEIVRMLNKAGAEE